MCLCLILVSTLVLPVLATEQVIPGISIAGLDAPVVGGTLDYDVTLHTHGCTLCSNNWAAHNGIYWSHSPIYDLTYGEILPPVSTPQSLDTSTLVA